MSDLPYIVSNLFTHVKPVKVYVRRHVKVTWQWKSTFNQIFWGASKHVLAWLLEITSSMKSPKNFFACLFSSRLSINSPWLSTFIFDKKIVWFFFTLCRVLNFPQSQKPEMLQMAVLITLDHAMLITTKHTRIRSNCASIRARVSLPLQLLLCLHKLHQITINE